MLNRILGLDPATTELLSASVALAWASALLDPFTDTFGSAAGFNAMADLAPDWAWGLVCLAIGIAGIAGWVTGRYRLRRTALLGAVGLWAVIAAMLCTSNYAGTGWRVYLLVAAGAALGYWQLEVRNGRR